MELNLHKLQSIVLATGCFVRKTTSHAVKLYGDYEIVFVFRLKRTNKVMQILKE